MVWYSHRKDWQDIEKQRKLGNHDHFSDKLSTARNSMVNDAEKRKLEADFNALVVKGNAGVDLQKGKMFKEIKEHIWEITVDFYPLSDYNKDNGISLFSKKESEKKNPLLYISAVIIAVLLIIIIILLL